MPTPAAATQAQQHPQQTHQENCDKDCLNPSRTRTPSPERPLEVSREGGGPNSAKFAAVINKIIEIVGTPEKGLSSTAALEAVLAGGKKRSRKAEQQLQQEEQQQAQEQDDGTEGYLEKVLVFSEWREVLVLLRASLLSLNINCLCYYGTRQEVAAIRAFCSSSRRAPRVLLCCLRRGGRGLNLTVARHVIFVDFPLNHTEETQAIGRVYRISQTKQTHVWRFIVKDTVEERIAELRQTRLDSHSPAEAILGKRLSLQDLYRLLQVGEKETAAETPRGGTTADGGETQASASPVAVAAETIDARAGQDREARTAGAITNGAAYEELESSVRLLPWCKPRRNKEDEVSWRSAEKAAENDKAEALNAALGDFLTDNDLALAEQHEQQRQQEQRQQHQGKNAVVSGRESKRKRSDGTSEARLI